MRDDVDMTVPPPETVYSSEAAVACDGGEGALGHPRVYLRMGSEGQVECPYCDRRFILDHGPGDLRQHAA
jgi:uncharacterized Zn-finger protein